MESNSWSFRFSNSSSSSSSSASRRRQSRSDLFLGGGYEEIDGDEDFKAQFLCPFCAEDFDIVGLCCHIDEEHPVETKNGRRRRLRKGGTNLTFSMLRKELREGNLQALLGGSSFVSSSNIEADPLLSSFMFSPPGDDPLSLQPLPIAEASAVKESVNKESSERKPQQPQISDKDHEEKARRRDFIQGLLMSTILDDNL
ncbi:COBRA-like protein 7 precursor [Hibiscus syriacus]|uniref:COBRA-like protein 7 n=1 Tax=Hibiscus syriacus TaxID=106335 RepID=A0A6A3CN01_HIBSY|nr:COBRA-like protein 7 precursor [Hibiscus syriacus]